MDIPRAVEQMYIGAKFRRADTYANLVRTWKDKRPVPTQAQLADAWVIVLENIAEQAIQSAAHENRVAILQDDFALGNMTYEQRVDLLTNILREAPLSEQVKPRASDN